MVSTSIYQLIKVSISVPINYFILDYNSTNCNSFIPSGVIINVALDISVCKKPLMPTTNAPQHVDKIKDYNKLYGDQADKILCLEASMQLQFDKFCDTSRPVYWPYIPLKF